jgi:hypothetical protein
MIFLEDIFVRAQFRGKDLGRALFARLAAIALENDCHGVMFNVLDWNKAAIDFYRKLGLNSGTNGRRFVCVEAHFKQSQVRCTKSTTQARVQPVRFGGPNSNSRVFGFSLPLAA